MAPNSRRNQKRKAESPSEEPDDPQEQDTEELPTSSTGRPQRKRQKQSSPSASPAATVKPAQETQTPLTKHLWGLLNEITSAVDDTGRLIASDFIELPPRRRYPDYYTTIKRPIAIEEIKTKIEKGEYENTEALKDDLALMTSNAKKYNVKGSSIYEDAVLIQRIVKNYPSDIPQTFKLTLRQPQQPKERKASETPKPAKQTTQEAQESILDHLENLKEPKTKRRYSDIFMDAPSKKEYPEYYAFIQRVICINEIRRNLKKGMYKTWADFEADVELVWSNAMAFNEDGSQVYEDAKVLKGAFEKAIREKKTELGEPLESLKVKINLQPPQPPPSTKIKLHVPQKHSNTPPAASPPAPPALAPVKTESPVLAPAALPPRTQSQVRSGSPLKNQISLSPSKSPPALRPAPPKAISPAAPPPSLAPPIQLPAASSGVDFNRTPVLPPQNTVARTLGVPQPLPRPPVPAQQYPQPSRTSMINPPVQENGVRPLQSLMQNAKRDRTLTLIPLITLSTATGTTQPNGTYTNGTTPTSSSSILLSITSITPPAPSTHTLILSVPRDTPELVLNAHVTKDLALQGSYTFTVTCNGRKLAPTLWPDASRRSGSIDSIAVTAPSSTPISPPSTAGGLASSGGLGDHWRFSVQLGDPGSVTTLEAGCVAFLKRDERGLLVRGERSRTGQAAGEDGGELERVVVLVMRGR